MLSLHSRCPNYFPLCPDAHEQIPPPHIPVFPGDSILKLSTDSWSSTLDQQLSALLLSGALSFSAMFGSLVEISGPSSSPIPQWRFVNIRGSVSITCVGMADAECYSHPRPQPVLRNHWQTLCMIRFSEVARKISLVPSLGTASLASLQGEKDSAQDSFSAMSVSSVHNRRRLTLVD